MIDTNVARATLGVAVLVLAACGSHGIGGDPDGVTVTERDSAGITIVENTVADPPRISRWSIDTVPSITIGADSGDNAYEFGTVGGVHQLPNGMFAVLNGQGESAFEFRFYDANGKHLATHGRRGQGPGDFAWVVFFGSAGGDTVVAMDYPNSRLSWISASKGYLRSLRVEEDKFKQLVGQDASGIRETLVPLGDSLFAVMAFRRIPGAASPIQRAQSYDVVDLAAEKTVPLARFDEPEMTPVRLSSGPTHISPMDAGNPVYIVDRARTRMCAAITNVTRISCVDSKGTRRDIRWSIDTVPYTAEDRRGFEERIRANMLRSSRRTAADVDMLLAAWAPPRHHPLFEVLRVDAAGNFWILENAKDAEGKRISRFRILNPDGWHIAFADAFPIHSLTRDNVHIGATSVLRAFEDADGVPKVGLFRIRKGG